MTAPNCPATKLPFGIELRLGDVSFDGGADEDAIEALCSEDSCLGLNTINAATARSAVRDATPNFLNAMISSPMA
jgi:hypothetical protein